MRVTTAEGVRGTWAALVAELDGDTAAAHRFIGAYADLIDGRVDRVERALVAGDREEAGAALLTVRYTSLMVGATAVADVASRALRATGRDEWPSDTLAHRERAAAGWASELRDAARGAQAEIEGLLDELADGRGQGAGSNR